MTKEDDKMIGSPDDHFKDVNRSLSFLRKDERFCDLAFICQTPDFESSKPKKPKRIFAHQAVFQPHSKLIANLIEISRQKQLSDCVFITLDGAEELAVEKLVEYLYLGQTTINKNLEKGLEDLVKRLELDISLDPAPISESSSENDIVEIPEKKSASPAKRGRKPGTSAKKGARSPRKSQDDSDDDGETKESDGDEMEKLKADAASKKSSVGLEHIEHTSDKEAKEFYKKALNPLFVDNAKPDNSKPDSSSVNAKNTPQKRRLTESDKKLASKAPKKARQEDDDETSDGGDTEAISARKKEIESVTFEPPKPVDVATDSESDAPKKNKPGPRRKKAGPSSATPVPTSSRRDSEPSVVSTPTPNKPEKPAAKSTGTIENMFATESVRYCGFCGKIFVGEEAHSKHLAEVHANEPEKPDESDKNDSDNESPKKMERGRKPGPAGRKAGPASSRKPGPATKKEEPKSPEAEKVKVTIKLDESPAKKMGPKSKSKPGPARTKPPGEKDAANRVSSVSSGRGGARHSSVVLSSDDEVDKNKSDQKKKKPTKKKSDKPESSTHHFLDSSSSDDDEKSTKTPKSPPTAKKPKIRISLGGGGHSEKKKTPGRRPSGSTGGGGGGGGALRKCKMCPETFDKPHNLKNHVLNHFKDQIYQRLPKSQPFLCPECKAPSRDKVTLMRHYAFSHKIIYEYCNESDLAGERADGESVTVKERSSSSKAGPSSSRKPGPSSAKKAGPKSSKDDKAKSKAEVSSDDSDDEDNDAKKSRTVTNDVKNSTDKNGKSDGDGDEEVFKIAPVNFSDSDSDAEVATNSASAAIKSFDDLFSDTEKEKNGNKPEEKKSDETGKDSGKDD